MQIAVLLHDCGKYISMEDVAECSYQIIMATEIIGLSYRGTPDDRKCGADINNSANLFIMMRLYSMRIAMDRESYILVAKLTAILRLANAMDRSHYQKVKGYQSSAEGQRICI